MAGPSTHKQTTREEFTQQANDYANSPLLSDSEKIERLIRATSVSSDMRVLEVATGPGHVAMGFAAACDTAIGVDLTAAPLTIAQERKQECGVANVHFQQSDAESLPFTANSFDVVVCRLAVHHFETPARILQEMARVCRSGGRVAVADLVVSEHPDRAEYQNQFEQVRDPSHVRALPLSELIELLADQDLEIDDVQMDVLVQTVDDWMSTAQTPPSKATEAREMIERDAQNDLSGTRPFYRENQLCFTQRTAIVVGRLMK